MKLLSNLNESIGWKQKAIEWLNFNKKSDLEKANPQNTNGQKKKKSDRTKGRNLSISSDNYSSRSDSWRQANIPLKLIDKANINRAARQTTSAAALRGRRNSWNVSRKVSLFC